jgi:hypothetical protein
MLSMPGNSVRYNEPPALQQRGSDDGPYMAYFAPTTARYATRFTPTTED